MEIKRTVTILVPRNPELLATVPTFQQEFSKLCCKSGRSLGAIAWQRKCYESVKGKPLAQMTLSAIRLVAAAYKSARTSKKQIIKSLSLNRGRKQRDRTCSFYQQVVKQLIDWVEPSSVLVLEDWEMPQVSNKLRVERGGRRCLSQGQHHLIRQGVTSKAKVKARRWSLSILDTAVSIVQSAGCAGGGNAIGKAPTLIVMTATMAQSW